MAKIEIVIEIEIDEPLEKVKKRTQHMVAKWPTISAPKIHISQG